MVSALNAAGAAPQSRVRPRRFAAVRTNIFAYSPRERPQGITRASFGVLSDGELLAAAGERLVEAADLAGGLVGVDDPPGSGPREGLLGLVA